jgi:glycosyltransferase involved in cell wall biosynthesis
VNASGPLISVIVPTRNSARTLQACLESVRSQHYSPIELVIVDNNSTDATLTIAQRFGDVVDSCGPERSAQRNRGAHLARGDYLLFIDSDMRPSPGVIGDCLNAIRTNQAPAIIVPEVSIGEGFLANCRALERSCYMGDDSIEAARFFSRQAFEQAGGFDENLVAMEDWDLTIRVASGRQLPRCTSQISHDEGRLRLRTILAKKRYYAASSLYYWRKRGRPNFSQANLVFRPAFMRNWRRLLRHPILTAGFLSLKSLEGAAVLWGILEAQAGQAKQLSS